MIAWLLHMGRVGRIGHSGLGEDAGLDSRFHGNDGDVLGPTAKKSPRRLPEALIAWCRRFVNRRQLRFAAQFEAA